MLNMLYHFLYFYWSRWRILILCVTLFSILNKQNISILIFLIQFKLFEILHSTLCLGIGGEDILSCIVFDQFMLENRATFNRRLGPVVTSIKIQIVETVPLSMQITFLIFPVFSNCFYPFNLLLHHCSLSKIKLWPKSVSQLYSYCLITYLMTMRCCGHTEVYLTNMHLTLYHSIL